MAKLSRTQSTGFHYLILGFKQLYHPKLRSYIWLPILINTLLFFCLILFSAYSFEHFLRWIDTMLPNWLQWLSGLLWIFFILAILLIFVFTFTLIANLIGAPFNGLLAESVERLYKAQAPKPGQASSLASFSQQIQFLAYYLPRALICLLLFLIPGTQLVAPIVWFVFNAWMLAFEYLSYPMENHHFPLTKIRQQLKQQRWLTFTFGISVLITSMIPFINFLVMPAAVIGATHLWIENFKTE